MWTSKTFSRWCSKKWKIEAVFKKVCHQWKTCIDACRDGYQTDPGAKELKTGILTSTQVIGFSNSTGDRKIDVLCHTAVSQTFATDSCDVDNRPVISVTHCSNKQLKHTDIQVTTANVHRELSRKGATSLTDAKCKVIYIFWQENEWSVTKPNKSPSCTGREMQPTLERKSDWQRADCFAMNLFINLIWYSTSSELSRLDLEIWRLWVNY